LGLIIKTIIFGNCDSLLEIKDADSVADGRCHFEAIGQEFQVAPSVHRTKQVGKLKEQIFI
jgi:hypothetical protein